eukprot:613133-Pleurochrysis_carterae.AAC.1
MPYSSQADSHPCSAINPHGTPTATDSYGGASHTYGTYGHDPSPSCTPVAREQTGHIVLHQPQLDALKAL